jgi:16S rRNA (guanine527-N7)-methyltransferase
MRRGGRARPALPRPTLQGDRGDPSVLASAGLNVSRETFERLMAYRALLEEWSRAIDLVGPRELSVFWSRHVLDSLQLLTIAPEARTWLDLGSGAGLPGLVLACALAETDGARITTVDTNPKRCAFQRTVVRTLDLPVDVIHGDIRTVSDPGAKVVTARALAPLPILLELAYRFTVNGARGLFPKGREAAAEIDAARAGGWMFHVKHHASLSDPQASILEFEGLGHGILGSD